MRAHEVPQDKAYIFDFDDTLVKTSAKVHIHKDGRKIKSITPEEYNFISQKKVNLQTWMISLILV